MKKILKLTAVIIFAAIIFCGCGNVNNVKIDIGKSELYSDTDRETVAREIKDTFYKNFNGCTLHTIKYAGDSWSKEDLSYCKSLKGKHYKDCIVFETEFLSPSDYKDGEAWNLNEEYTYSWHFAREDGGNWEYITSGQG